MNQQLAAEAAHVALLAAAHKVLDSRTASIPRWVVTAKPYLKAIRYNDYGLEDPVMCVLYALNNMTSWRGEQAKMVKVMLNDSIKEDLAK
jgi:hypothetical protein